MKTLLLFLLTVTLGFAGDIPQAPEKPFIYVTGSAKVTVPTDAILIRFDVVRRDKDQRKAFAAVIEKSLRLLHAIKVLEIREDDVEAFAITVIPAYNYGDKGRTFDGYDVRRSFSVRLRDTKRIVVLITTLQDIGTETIANPEPVSFKESETTRTAFKQAFADAEARAESLASASGLRVLGVLAVSEAPLPEISRRFYDAGRDEGMTMSKFNVASAQDTFITPPIEFTSSVHVVFQVGPK